MPDDALESVLRLVADGHLSAEEASPILDALEARSKASDDGQRTHRGPDPGPAAGSAAPPAGGSGRAIRVEVTEAGRKVVNLRVPLALGRAAMQRIPGLSEATTERIREAIEGGITGPIVAVDDADGDGVRIVIE
jgi:hypothetical protein